MTRGERGDILHLRLALVARRAGGALVATAFLVRLAATELAFTLLELAVVTWVAAPPPAKAVLSHVGGVARALKGLTSAAVATGRLPDDGGLQAPAEGADARRSGIRVRLPTPREVTLLTDDRVRRLQRRIVSVVFLRRFGLTVENDGLDVLSAYSSVSWLARNLSAAAGYGARPPWTAEAGHRLRVVFPVLVRILALHSRYVAPQPVAGRSEAGSTQARPATGGLITAAVYPHRVTAERVRCTLEAEHTCRRLRAHTLRSAALELRLERHLHVITLLQELDVSRARSGGRGLGPATAARALPTLERIRFRTTGGTHVRMDQ